MTHASLRPRTLSPAPLPRPAAPPALLGALLGVLLGLLLGACSSDPIVPEGRGGREPVELQRSGAAPAGRTEVGKLLPSDAWSVEGAEAELREFGPAGNANLAVTRGADFDFHIPLDELPSGAEGLFQRLTIFLRTPRQGVPRELIPRLVGEDGERAAPTRALYASHELQAVSFDFRDLREPDVRPDRLVVEVRGYHGPFSIEAVMFEALPRASFLPAPEAGAEFIEVERDLRPGYGLSVGESLVGTTRPPLDPATGRVRADARFAFSFGVPADLVSPDKTSLRVTLSAAGERREETYRIDPRWRSGSISLADLPDQPLQVRFELEGSSGAVCAVAEARVETTGRDAPTVVLVTSDTHRADHVGVAGSGIEVHTPTLDGLAARGVLFERALSSTNITNPSHTALLTGIHPRDTRIVDNRHALAEEAETLAEHFAAAGYTTWASVSARHLRPSISGLGQGFSRFAVPAGVIHYATDSTESLEDWLPEADDMPLFVWLHIFDAHHPYAPPKPFDRHYYGDGDPFDPELPEPEGVPAKVLPFDLEGLRDLEFPRAQYRAEVDYLDDVLGRFLAEPRFENAIVGVTGDHGESLGEHGIFFSHGGLYPETLHVPLVLAFPGAPAGTRIPETVSHLGLGRTLLELAEIPSAERYPGESLERLWTAPSPSDSAPPAPVFALSDNAIIASVTRGHEHLILHLRKHHRRESAHMKRKYQVEYYDLSVDPGCKNDLVYEQTDRARELCALLVDWLRSAAADDWVGERSDDAELLRGLRALGYSDEQLEEAKGEGEEERRPADLWLRADFDLDTNGWLRER